MRVLPVTAGTVAVVAGVVFTLQGVGLLGGSPMTGSTLWAVLGPIIAVLGVALLVVGLRGRRNR
ncbi:hypothetical protein [Agromyces sp. ZXT2-6]|uniref:hypothetical protein n=1 Tax=Agromyces sp. ZXT2-6 TaxID=3461153 RepID=UPI0040549FB6